MLSGGGRFKLDHAIVTVGPGDAIYCPSAVVPEWEAGENGSGWLPLATASGRTA